MTKYTPILPPTAAGRQAQEAQHAYVVSEWRRCSTFLASLLEVCETHRPEDVLAELLGGSMLLVPGERSAAVAEIVRKPKGSTLHLFLAGGDLAEIRAAIPPLAAWAKAQGFAKLSIDGRKGWAREFAGLGFHAPRIYIEKDLAA